MHRSDIDRERGIAIKEGAQIKSANDYFDARRETVWTKSDEKLFCDGFDRGYQAALDKIARDQEQP